MKKGIGPRGLGASKSPMKMYGAKSPAKQTKPTKAKKNLQTAATNNAREALLAEGIDNPNMSDAQVRGAAKGKGLMQGARSKAIKTQVGSNNTNSNK